MLSIRRNIMSEQVFVWYFSLNGDGELYNLNNMLSQGWKVKSITPLPDIKDDNNQIVSRILFILEEV